MKKSLYALLLLQVNCASIVASSTDRLRVTAAPSSATVSVDGQVQGPAPITVEVSKRHKSFVEVSAPGFNRATCSTNMSASGGYIAADIALCLFLFPIGCISFIDAGGAWNELEQPICRATLVRETTH